MAISPTCDYCELCPHVGESSMPALEQLVLRAGDALAGRPRPQRAVERWIVRRESWLPPFPLTRRYDRDRDATSRLEGGVTR